jgi:hypothetical protein
MMTKKKDWQTLSPLLQDFMQRHRISPKQLESAQIVGAAKELITAMFPHAARHFEVRQYREPEIVVVANDPFLAQQLRLQGTKIVQEIQTRFPAFQVTRVRVVGR